MRSAILSLGLLSACMISQQPSQILAETSLSGVSLAHIRVVNDSNVDICVDSYRWPATAINADVFTIADSLGTRAEYIGVEPTVMGSHVFRVRRGTVAETSVDLAGSYDLSGLRPPLSLRYKPIFEPC